jgi:hypothetical protein
MLTPGQINLAGTGGPPIELGGYIGKRGVDARPAAIDGVDLSRTQRVGNVTYSVTAEFNSAHAMAASDTIARKYIPGAIVSLVQDGAVHLRQAYQREVQRTGILVEKTRKQRWEGAAHRDIYQDLAGFVGWP